MDRKEIIRAKVVWCQKLETGATFRYGVGVSSSSRKKVPA